MGVPKRSEDNVPISISLSRKLLGDVDARAAALGLSRSVYLSNLARSDIARGGDFVLREDPAVTPALQKDTVHKIVTAVKQAVSPGGGPPPATGSSPATNYRGRRRAQRPATPAKS